MYLKCHRRFKDGKEHRYWSIAEKRCVSRGRVVDRHREWYVRSAMADFLDADPAVVAKDTLYRCLDKLRVDKEALFGFLKQRWQDLFGVTFEVLLYDLTSTYFESDPPCADGDNRRATSSF